MTQKTFNRLFIFVVICMLCIACALTERVRMEQGMEIVEAQK